MPDGLNLCSPPSSERAYNSAGTAHIALDIAVFARPFLSSWPPCQGPPHSAPAVTDWPCSHSVQAIIFAEAALPVSVAAIA